MPPQLAESRIHSITALIAVAFSGMLSACSSGENAQGSNTAAEARQRDSVREVRFVDSVADASGAGRGLDAVLDTLNRKLIEAPTALVVQESVTRHSGPQLVRAALTNVGRKDGEVLLTLMKQWFGGPVVQFQLRCPDVVRSSLPDSLGFAPRSPALFQRALVVVDSLTVSDQMVLQRETIEGVAGDGSSSTLETPLYAVTGRCVAFTMIP